LDTSKPKGLQRIAKISQGLREENK